MHAVELFADEWRDYAAEKPPAAGLYEWRVSSQAVSGLVVRSLAHNRKRGAGHRDIISPAFDHWDGYSVHVPAGTQWREPPEGVKLEHYEQRLVCAEGVDFEPCPFCHKTPTLKGCTSGSGGGVVITSNAHTINTWWLECCAWAKTPRYSDPRKLSEDRSRFLAAPPGNTRPTTDLKQRLWGALRFAASRSVITAAEETAILAAFPSATPQRTGQ